MATPYGPTRERRHGSVLGPLVLIFIGGVFLLQNTGLVSPTVWGSLWRLWPLLLILAGLDLLFGRRAPALVALLGLGTIVLALGIAAGINVSGLSVGSRPSTTTGPVTSQRFPTDLNGANQSSVVVRFGAGQLFVQPLTGGQSGQLASMTYDGPSDLLAQPNYTVSAGTGRLEYQLSGRNGQAILPMLGTDRPDAPRMSIDLAPGVPITTLNVQAGACQATIDLSSLRVNSIDMAIGATSARVRLPDSGVTTAHISGGASTLNIEVPPGVAAQVRQRGGLSTFTIDQTRFPQAGDGLYRSADWDTAANKADITIETGVTTITVN